MAEQIKPSLEDLLKATPEQQKEEEELGKRGLVAEKYCKIQALERSRMQTALETVLQERIKNKKAEEIEQRKQTTKRYFTELMQSPSFEKGATTAVTCNRFF